MLSAQSTRLQQALLSKLSASRFCFRFRFLRPVSGPIRSNDTVKVPVHGVHSTSLPAHGGLDVDVPVLKGAFGIPKCVEHLIRGIRKEQAKHARPNPLPLSRR
jgi:hypothetical protein